MLTGTLNPRTLNPKAKRREVLFLLEVPQHKDALATVASRTNDRTSIILFNMSATKLEKLQLKF